MSRAGLVRGASRAGARARIALSGSTGAGKTWSALSIAAELDEGKGVVVVDTEKEKDGAQKIFASEYYADRYKFELIGWEPPFNPRELATTIKDLSKKYDVVIIDSASHFWSKEGGTLDLADGKFGGWKNARPAQEDMVTAFKSAESHIIFCMRSKMDYQVEEVMKQGQKKQQVTKIGLAPIQSEDLAFEFSVHLDINSEHRIEVSKTRIEQLSNRSFPAGHEKEVASVIKAWLEEAPEPSQQQSPNLRAEQQADASSSPPLADEWDIMELRTLIGKMDEDIKAGVLKEWKSDWGSVKRGAKNPIPASHIDVARTLVKSQYELQRQSFDQRRKGANAQMQKVGVKADDARHELVSTATDGATESTKELTQEQYDAVLDYCRQLGEDEE